MPVLPYRLDLTVNALRRLPSNPVDVLTSEGEYVRALAGFGSPAVIRVTQTRSDELTVTVAAEGPDHGRIVALVRSMLGVDRDLAAFEGSAQQIAWLAPLVQRMRGLKPPRYPTLWEACVNAIAFQQVSLHSATAMVGRLVLALGDRVEGEDGPLFVFPRLEQVEGAEDAVLRGTGLSAGKIGTLRRVAEALPTPEFSEEALNRKTSAEAAQLLRQIKGIGPWTAAVVLLRGLGRLDVFPPKDSGVAANLGMLAGSGPSDVPSLVEALHPQPGMLYFYLLLARLEVRGEIRRSPFG